MIEMLNNIPKPAVKAKFPISSVKLQSLLPDSVRTMAHLFQFRNLTNPPKRVTMVPSHSSKNGNIHMSDIVVKSPFGPL
jgi:hypothetical protein